MQLIAGQASLDRLKAGGRRLHELSPLLRRMGDLMCEHGPSPIRSHCCYLMAYATAAALSSEAAHELIERSRQSGTLARLREEDDDVAIEFTSLWYRGQDDALAGRPPEAPPAGFPADLLQECYA